MTTRVAFKQALGKGRRWGREVPRSKSLLQQQLVVRLRAQGELRCGANLGGGGEGNYSPI